MGQSVIYVCLVASLLPPKNVEHAIRFHFSVLIKLAYGTCVWLLRYALCTAWFWKQMARERERMRSGIPSVYHDAYRVRCQFAEIILNSNKSQIQMLSHPFNEAHFQTESQHTDTPYRRSRTHISTHTHETYEAIAPISLDPIQK